MQNTNSSLIESLGSRGEKHLAANIHHDEKILAKVKGTWGQGLVLTDRHVYIVKWGYMTGNTFGGRCSAFSYDQVVGIEIKKNLLTGVIEVLTAATRDAHLSYWAQKGNSAFKSNYAISFAVQMFDKFQRATVLARDLISKGSR
jgi:hypothetical protein